MTVFQVFPRIWRRFLLATPPHASRLGYQLQNSLLTSLVSKTVKNLKKIEGMSRERDKMMQRGCVCVLSRQEPTVVCVNLAPHFSCIDKSRRHRGMCARF